MSLLRPTDPALLARAVADTLAVAADPYAREASIFYWERGRSRTTAVAEAVTGCPDATISGLGKQLLDAPLDPVPYFALRDALEEPERAGVTAAIFDLAWQAECVSRLGYHVGRQYEPVSAAVSVDDLLTLPPGPTVIDGSGVEILVVVPFRDRGTDRARLRNLLACLLSLRDQSFPRHAYQVAVVESDDVSRWSQVVKPYADHYLFAPKAGYFSKSWAINVGVANAPVQAELICMLDADVLADRDFIARNAARFRRPGTAGHLTYRDMFCVDRVSTAWAIRSRLHARAPEADPDHLRGFLLRRPPGCSLWVRAEAFYRIGGMDERFEGWGGEDNDFVYRFDINAPLDHYDDWLLHMYHPASAVLREDGELVNADIPALSWRPDGPIGRVDRFAETHPAPAHAVPTGGAEQR